MRLISILDTYLPSILPAVDRNNSTPEPKKAVIKLDLVVVCAYKSNTWQAEAGGSHVPGQSGLCEVLSQMRVEHTVPVPFAAP